MEITQDSLILACLHGSRAYGMQTEGSDVDMKGVMFGPKDCYLGYLNTFEQLQDNSSIEAYFLPGFEGSLHDDAVQNGLEGTFYDIRKFCKLAAGGNPNAIELLFQRPEEIVFCSDVGDILIDNRDAFLSSKMVYALKGYAIAQLKRLRNHRGWILNAMEKPIQADFGIKEGSVLHKEQRKRMNTLVGRAIQTGMNRVQAEKKVIADLPLADEIKEVLEREVKYQRAMADYSAYKGWAKGRSSARAELERQYGYDTKHASHFIRLARTCKEYLTTGEYSVYRKDREQLVGIRRGLWTFDEFSEKADILLSEISSLQDNPPIQVRKGPDHKTIQKICMAAVGQYLAG